MTFPRLGIFIFGAEFFLVFQFLCGFQKFLCCHGIALPHVHDTGKHFLSLRVFIFFVFAMESFDHNLRGALSRHGRIGFFVRIFIHVGTVIRIPSQALETPVPIPKSSATISTPVITSCRKTLTFLLLDRLAEHRRNGPFGFHYPSHATMIQDENAIMTLLGPRSRF